MKIFGAILGKLWKNYKEYLKNSRRIERILIMISRGFPINFRITCGECGVNLKKFFWDFWNQLEDILEVFWWNFGKIAIKFWRNLKEIEKKIVNVYRKIMGKLYGKTEVIRN